jgi:hypothetical protein
VKQGEAKRHQERSCRRDELCANWKWRVHNISCYCTAAGLYLASETSSALVAGKGR